MFLHLRLFENSNVQISYIQMYFTLTKVIQIKMVQLQSYITFEDEQLFFCSFGHPA
jgi:hypothetical protein